MKKKDFLERLVNKKELMNSQVFNLDLKPILGIEIEENNDRYIKLVVGNNDKISYTIDSLIKDLSNIDENLEVKIENTTKDSSIQTIKEEEIYEIEQCWNKETILSLYKPNPTNRNFKVNYPLKWRGLLLNGSPD